MTSPSPEAPSLPVDLLREIVGLKDLTRSGWQRRGVPRPESVAAHSWGVAWLTVVLCPPHLDLQRCLVYAVVHDLAEVRVGDISPHDGVLPHEKVRRETEAIHSLCQDLPPHVQRAWEAYEAQADDEARFVRQLDRLDMALTASAYAHHERLADPDEFFRSAARVVTDPTLLDLLQRLRHH